MSVPLPPDFRRATSTDEATRLASVRNGPDHDRTRHQAVHLGTNGRGACDLQAARPMPVGSASTHGAVTRIAGLLADRTGQQIDATRLWRVGATLGPLLRDRSLSSLEALVAGMDRDPALAESVVDALLNQETSFYRDAALYPTIVEALADAETSMRRTRLWSAACSTGQEPLSLAMLFAEREERSGTVMPEIIASDVSETAIRRARAGRYSQFEIQRGLPVGQMIRWFDTDGRNWTAKVELLRRIAFRKINLVADRFPGGAFDLVLCRNVLLYLTPDRRRKLLDRLALSVRPGGYLVLGAGETVIGQTTSFRPSERFRGLYQVVTPVRGTVQLG